jgi:hypothetical protein
MLLFTSIVSRQAQYFMVFAACYRNQPAFYYWARGHSGDCQHTLTPHGTSTTSEPLVPVLDRVDLVPITPPHKVFELS